MAKFVDGGAARGVTDVDNAFILNHLPNAPENAVRVYLYGLMLCRYTDAPAIEDVLGISEGELGELFAYWQRKGLVRIASNEPLIVEYLKVEGTSTAPRRYAMLLEKLSAAAPERVFAASELSAVCEWIEVFGLDEDAAVLVAVDCVKRRGAKVKLWQMNAEARRWADAGVHTAEEALDYIAKRDDTRQGAQRILTRWKLRRAATEDELELYKKWTDVWHMSEEAIAAACVELTSAAQPSFKYLDSVLATFRANGAIDGQSIAALRRERDSDRELARMMLERAGISRAPSAQQQDDVGAWRNRRRMPPELLLLAGEASRQSDKPWANIKRTVQRWLDSGISELDAAKEDIERQAKEKIAEKKRGRALAHSGRTYSKEELDSMGVELLDD